MNALPQIQTYFNALQFEFSYLTIIDILLVAFILYWIIAGLRGTRGIRILWGLVVLGLIFILSQVLHLVALEWLLKASFAIIVIAIPVVFQPELRKLLERAGTTGILKRLSRSPKERAREDTLRAVANAARTLAANKTGGLILITCQDSLKEYADTGTALDANVSEELLLNIFFPKSPLHDGAVIIANNRIVAASCILPLSDKKKSYQYGTRHRAALGVTEQTDALVVVVSEERGVITVVKNEYMKEKIAPERLYTVLSRYI